MKIYIFICVVVLEVLSFCDAKTLLNCRLISIGGYKLLRTALLWKRLVERQIICSQLPTALLTCVESSENGLCWETIYFHLKYILKHRDDISVALSETYLLAPLSRDWAVIGRILLHSHLISPKKRASAFNLEGNKLLKREFVHLIHVQNRQFTGVLQAFCRIISIERLSGTARYGLLSELADWYWQQNPNLKDKFENSQNILLLFFAMLDIEADLKRKVHINKISKREFIKTFQASYGKRVFTDELLGSVYDFVLLEGLELNVCVITRPGTTLQPLKSGDRSKFLCYTMKNFNGDENSIAELELIEVIKE